MNNINSNKKTTGNLGEDIATKYLETLGYTIVERNFRSAYGEIDIICKKDNYLIFVEVKARKGLKFGQPNVSISLKKQKNIINSSLMYMSENNIIDENIRFDAILLFLSENVEIEHIVDAFQLR